MNAWNLLNKGHTIKGFNSRPNAYKLAIRGVAPNFLAGKIQSPTPPHRACKTSQPTFFDIPNPPAPEPSPAPAPPVQAPQPVHRQPLWNRLATTCRELVQQWSPGGARLQHRERCIRLLCRLRAVTSVCRTALQHSTASRKASPFVARTVQTELALDRITVVRNDLSEDDMEVIRVVKKEKPAKHDQCQVLSTVR
jgi:hypothetical protein